MDNGLGHSHEQWRDWIKEQQRGEQSIMEFCRQRGLAAHNFHYHKKRMKKREADLGFVEVKPRESRGVRLIYERKSWRLEIEKDFDPSLVRAVVEALG
jgi:hypothetical protein